MKYFKKRIMKDLKKVISGEPVLNTLGSSDDQSKGFLREFSSHVIPSNYRYEAKEFVHARIPVYDQNFSNVDVIVPVVNIGRKSIQGVATFGAVVPYPVDETYVHLRFNLVPHSLAIERRVDPKRIVKGNMIRSKAINAINGDKKLIKKLNRKTRCAITGIGSSYICEIDTDKYPPGVFTVVPYYNHTVILAKDAGISVEACPNEPRYDLRKIYEALSGVGGYIAANPQQGKHVGKFYMDIPLNLLLPRLLKDIKVPESVLKEQTSKKAAQPAPPPPYQSVRTCLTCNNKARFIQKYEKWYCDHCKKYL